MFTVPLNPHQPYLDDLLVLVLNEYRDDDESEQDEDPSKGR